MGYLRFVFISTLRAFSKLVSHINSLDLELIDQGLKRMSRTWGYASSLSSMGKINEIAPSGHVQDGWAMNELQGGWNSASTRFVGLSNIFLHGLVFE